MPNVLITNKGMDFILSAHDQGVFINLKYFVPVYDDRIDPNLRDTAILSAYEDIADASLETPIGEIIWNQGDYILDSDQKFLISANTFTNPNLDDSYQKALALTNTKNNIPLSNQISATDWGVSSTFDGLFNWEGTNAAVVLGNNDRPFDTKNDFWNVGNYYPVYDSSAQNDLRGSFKCQIYNNIGNFKFNKIALYAIAVQDGVETGDICFFGEAYLESPAIVSNLEVGFDRFEFDIQIDISGVSANFDELFYSSSADYWSQSPGGLYYPNKIGVGQFTDNQKEISASLHVRKSRDEEGDIDYDSPIFRMDYDNEHFLTFDLSEYSDKAITSAGSDIEIGISDWENYLGDAISVIPKISETLTLGNNSNRWREIWLSNTDEYGDPDPNANPCLTIYNNLTNAIIIQDTFDKYQLKIGRPGSDDSILTAITINDLRIEFEPTDGEYDDDNISFNAAIVGADIFRKNQNLLMFTAGYTNNNIYLIAGLDDVFSENLNHREILSGAIDNESIYANKLDTNSKIDIIAGSIGLNGSVVLRSPDTAANALFISKYNKRMLFASGISANATFDEISYRIDDIESDIDVNFDNLLQTDSRLYLISEKIKVQGDIDPIEDATYSLGNFNKRWNYIHSIASYTERINSKYGMFEGNRGLAAGVNQTISLTNRSTPTSNFCFGDIYNDDTEVGKVLYGIQTSNDDDSSHVSVYPIFDMMHNVLDGNLPSNRGFISYSKIGNMLFLNARVLTTPLGDILNTFVKDDITIGPTTVFESQATCIVLQLPADFIKITTSQWYKRTSYTIRLTTTSVDSSPTAYFSNTFPGALIETKETESDIGSYQPNNNVQSTLMNILYNNVNTFWLIINRTDTRTFQNLYSGAGQQLQYYMVSMQVPIDLEM